jgi:hypothetical protein
MDNRWRLGHGPPALQVIAARNRARAEHIGATGPVHAREKPAGHRPDRAGSGHWALGCYPAPARGGPAPERVGQQLGAAV